MKAFPLYCILLLLLTSCDQATIGADVSETYFVRYKGADMPVYARGNTASGKLILVIHGGPGGDGYVYSQLYFSDQLEKEYGMLYWDQRGQGASQGQYGGSQVTIEQMREDLRGLCWG
mgnify:CR=1 FL=1